MSSASDISEVWPALGEGPIHHNVYISARLRTLYEWGRFAFLRSRTKPCTDLDVEEIMALLHELEEFRLHSGRQLDKRLIKITMTWLKNLQNYVNAYFNRALARAATEPRHRHST